MEAIETTIKSSHCHSTSNTPSLGNENGGSGNRSAKSRRREFAPLASLEDLEEYKPKKTNEVINCLPVINDDHEFTAIDPKVCVFAAVKSNNQHQRPESIRSGGIEPPPKLPFSLESVVNLENTTTPPTPRIDISCASSSSTISDEIPSSEKELLRYGLGIDCKEEVEDLRSSTEEIAFEDSSAPPDDSRRIIIENLRRGSHPANIFSRKLSTMTLGENFFRKPSVYSLGADAFSPRMGRHASFGSADAHRPKSCAPSPTPTMISGRRSVSPHLLMFETSFCGNRPMAGVGLDAEVYAPPPTTSSSEVEVHHFPCDSPHVTKAQVERHNTPPLSPPHQSTSKSFAIRSFESNWCERFVIPNQPSMEEPDDDNCSDGCPGGGGGEGIDENKVRLDRDDDHIKCTKDESTDFSDKELKVDISDSEIILQDEDEDVGVGLSNPNLPHPRVEEDQPQESTGLFLDLDGGDDESELPYVPTTLPLEKSSALPIVPIKDRATYYVPTTPIQRPRSTQPPNLTKIEDYITGHQDSQGRKGSNSGGAEKMKISLPRDDSIGDGEPGERSRTPKKEMPTTWTNFAEMGLRNPRNLRRNHNQEPDFK